MAPRLGHGKSFGAVALADTMADGQAGGRDARDGLELRGASKADLGGFPGPTGLDGAQALVAPPAGFVIANGYALPGAGAANAHQAPVSQNSPLAGRVTAAEASRTKPDSATTRGDWPLASL